MSDDAIRWPEEFEPARSPVYVRNRLDMAGDAGAVWRVLIHAARWPQWYANSAQVRIDGGGADLFAQARFTWRTFGVNLVSTVEEFVPGERIAWRADAAGIRAYHAWLIIPTPGGCRVLTEETQHGFVARGARVLFSGRMERWHQRWLEALAEQAAGPG